MQPQSEERALTSHTRRHLQRGRRPRRRCSPRRPPPLLKEARRREKSQISSTSVRGHRRPSTTPWGWVRRQWCSRLEIIVPISRLATVAAPVYIYKIYKVSTSVVNELLSFPLSFSLQMNKPLTRQGGKTNVLSIFDPGESLGFAAKMSGDWGGAWWFCKIWVPGIVMPT